MRDASTRLDLTNHSRKLNCVERIDSLQIIIFSFLQVDGDLPRKRNLKKKKTTFLDCRAGALSVEVIQEALTSDYEIFCRLFRLFSSERFYSKSKTHERRPLWPELLTMKVVIAVLGLSVKSFVFILEISFLFWEKLKQASQISLSSSGFINYYQKDKGNEKSMISNIFPPFKF